MRAHLVPLTTVLPLLLAGSARSAERPWRTPFDIAWSPHGRALAVSDSSANSVTFLKYDEETGTLSQEREVRLGGGGAGLVWAPDGSRLYAAEYGAGTVAEIDPGSGGILRRFEVGRYPVGLALAPERGLLFAANGWGDDISAVELATGKERARIPVPREPFFLAVTPDGKTLLAGNLLPQGSAEDPTLAAAVSVIDIERLEKRADVRLPPGSTSVREIAVSPDGRWAYVVHTLGRFNVPATQLERGWVNTNALSILDLNGPSLYATVLLDQPYEGATDPWGVALARDGSALWISLRGVHRLARIDLERLHRHLEGRIPDPIAVEEAYGASARSIWLEIKKDPAKRAELANELSALYAAELITLHDLPGKGPRGLDLSPDGRHLAVALAWDESAVLAAADGRVVFRFPLAPPREPDLVRRGEILFHDATLSFQHWLSCSTCHPDGGRNDGLRWDLLNDGLGTPQRTRSLVWTHKTRPTTARGVRKGIEDSVPKGLLFLLREPDPETAKALIAYISSLEPEPSPFLEKGGGLSESARRGRAIFEGQGGCTRCHEGALGSDNKAHDIGTGGRYRKGERFYTPKLVEVHRVRPYLHDGRAATLEEIFTRWDPDGRHGRAARLSPEELRDLVEYLKSR